MAAHAVWGLLLSTSFGVGRPGPARPVAENTFMSPILTPRRNFDVARARFRRIRFPWSPDGVCGASSSLTVLALAMSLAAPGAVFGANADAADRLVQRGIAAYQRGALEDAASDWAEAARLQERAGRTREQVAALTRLARALQALGRHQEAGERLERARTIASGSGDRGGLVRVLAALGAGALAAGSTQRAEPYLSEARAIASAP